MNSTNRSQAGQYGMQAPSIEELQRLYRAAHERDELRKLVKRIQDALATGEEGEGLVEVARNANRAEMEHAVCILTRPTPPPPSSPQS